MTPPILNIRSFSDDQFILDKVFYSNSYHLRGIKDRDKAPVVVDIGAHCGYFTFTALALGAKKVYSIEPFIENYKMLLKNTNENLNVITHCFGISRDRGYLDFSYPIPEKSYVNFSNIEPYLGGNEKHYTSPSETLNNYLISFVKENVDILKINIGYQERDILVSSEILESKVNNICGETILEVENIPAFKSEMSAKGFIKSHIQTINEKENRIIFIFSKNNIEEYFNL